MKTTHEEILKAIISSKILENHLQQNSSLGELINDADNPNIHYGPEFVPTIYQREIFEQRVKIGLMEDADELSKANANAFQKVMAFMEKYPESKISVVAFNCTDAHFDVWYGLLDNHPEALCALKGGYIPNYAFEKQDK
jgi:hypothetical protein